MLRLARHRASFSRSIRSTFVYDIVRCLHDAPKLPLELRNRVKSAPLASAYDPASVEDGWQQYWQQSMKADSGSDKSFSMLLPPPNVTGALHIGHALTITIQDTLARWHRMRGYDVHWVPGLDHAGIATQSVVERKLQKETGQSRHDLGREAFVEQVWDWNERYGGRIMDQIDSLGATIDKSHSFFTLDAERSEAVNEAFVRLYEKGLISRKRRMVNWCPTLHTAISDIEVDTESLEGPTKKLLPGRTRPVEFGVMHRFKYKLSDSDDVLEVDTTRPETMFGDVAVAVHPEDDRYKHFIGKNVLHPYTQKPIPVVGDAELVNMELGTGVVKVTPAHDPKDYECGKRLGLEEIEIIDGQGKLCGDIDAAYIGMDRFDARAKLLEELEGNDTYIGKFAHPTSLSICSRSGDIIEPLLMPQWFVNCDEMASRAASHVRDGSLAIEPSSHNHMWFYFLDNIQDWCISRQLWWGHRIPAYRVRSSKASHSSDTWVVAKSREEAREKAEKQLGVPVDDSELEQDPDVLDTWFSSGLLPLSAMGWPGTVDSPPSNKYPLSVMETGSDILFFWVARMAMLCEEFSGQLPFEKILLHPMVRDKSGRKMSKSLGNVIDPLHVINGMSLDDLLTNMKGGNIGEKELQKAEKELKKEFPKGIPSCGTDALRFTLASYLQQGRQINMDVQRVVSYRHFCNKVWNAVRYALPLLETTSIQSSSAHTLEDMKSDMGLVDRWILSKLARVVMATNNGIESNQLASSVSSLQSFYVQELCDVYIEYSKPVLYGNRIDVSEFGSAEALEKRQLASQATLHRCLDYSMRLLHPFTPFVTEELWQRIREYDPLSGSDESTRDTSILLAKYPEEADVASWIDEEAENQMELVLNVVHGIRSLKHTIKKLAPDAASDMNFVAQIVSTDESTTSCIQNAVKDIERQSRSSTELSASTEALLRADTSRAMLANSISDTCRVLMPVPKDADTSSRVKQELQRLRKRAEKAEKALDGIKRRRSEPQYAVKVPEQVQAQDLDRQNQQETELHATRKSIEALEDLEQQY